MTTVCLNANTLTYPSGGGHRWVYLNWALGMRQAGCRVIWLEGASNEWPAERTLGYVAALKEHLGPFGLADSIAFYSHTQEPLRAELAAGCLSVEEAWASAEMVLNFAYYFRQDLIDGFRRSALVDIDPGLLQVWMHEKNITMSRHDVYFTIGETVGRPSSQIPDVGIPWLYTPPAVSLEDWRPPAQPPAADAPFTTVTQWDSSDWVTYRDESYSNSKKEGFEPLLDVPSLTQQPLELAVNLGQWGGGDRAMLLAKGWRLADPAAVAGSPQDYHRYIQQSRGEFSSCKPSCVRMGNAWISDRTLCYLASGRPAVVQHTGASRFLPDDCGLLRFKTATEAAAMLERAAGDYAKHSAAARALAEEFFDAGKVTRRILEIALA